ncbi:hypothetical protein NMY22_g990 [Coprinellus aureogranulatus]|nr:hypothetical protein NMY22_g990 [Coprinellus aureogranulatus]
MSIDLELRSQHPVGCYPSTLFPLPRATPPWIQRAPRIAGVPGHERLRTRLERQPEALYRSNRAIAHSDVANHKRSPCRCSDHAILEPFDSRFQESTEAATSTMCAGAQLAPLTARLAPPPELRQRRLQASQPQDQATRETYGYYKGCCSTQRRGVWVPVHCQRKVHESWDDDAKGEEEEPEEMVVSVRGRTHKKVSYVESQSEEDLASPPTRTTGFGGRSTRNRVIDTLMDDDEDEDPQPARRSTRSQSTKNLEGFVEEDEDAAMHAISKKRALSRASGRQTRSRARQRQSSQDHDYEEDRGGSSNSGEDADGSLVEDDLDLALEPEPEREPEDDNDGKPYALRQRAKINYAIPPPVEEMTRPPPKPANRTANRGPKGRRLGQSHKDSSPRKPFGVPFGAGAMPAGGTPLNLGGDAAALADADPLGVNQNVTFDEVGGVDDHIHALKEMTLLPLPYPEVLQRFNVTPPRGVLIRGPPATGKTLLARALAASSRSGGRHISFFMRKGADCSPKWVGEAVRQLRLLFEEARNSRPSIIFFDEIDGLAPARSSRRDQIHASIVSTLLALMGDMDGRRQVIVTGATNRPDAVDPALRRPGRFDGEFYIGLPRLEAREKILGIMTKKWENWNPEEEGEKGERVRERLEGLAGVTKGYGGAELRGLCTEAVLNAIQRRYPQVYKSTDRLLSKPETINVTLRDFMISIKQVVPSSARSSTSAATPLPPQFEPLLSETLEQAQDVIQRVVPFEKKLSALEEVEFEDGPEETALEREMLAQSVQTLCVYRPRVVIHGPVGMGQGYIGAVALHHLEAIMSRVWSQELSWEIQQGLLNLPSFSFSLRRSDTSRRSSTFRHSSPLSTVPSPPFPRTSKHGSTPPETIAPPSSEKRSAFFEPLLKDVARRPVELAGGVKRRKRIFEELPIAPPLEPRKPSATELALQEENDQKTTAILEFRLGPILQEMKRKFRRRSITYENSAGYALEVNTTPGAVPQTQPHTNSVIDITGDGLATQPADQQEGPAVQQVMLQRPPLYDMGLDRMHSLLYKDHYLTPQSFLDDVGKIVHNVDVRSHEDLDRLHRMGCERMAVREQQKMEAQNKDEGKGKEKGSRNASGERADGPQTRRSTRSNGTGIIRKYAESSFVHIICESDLFHPVDSSARPANDSDSPEMHISQQLAPPFLPAPLVKPSYTRPMASTINNPDDRELTPSGRSSPRCSTCGELTRKHGKLPRNFCFLVGKYKASLLSTLELPSVGLPEIASKLEGGEELSISQAPNRANLAPLSKLPTITEVQEPLYAEEPDNTAVIILPVASQPDLKSQFAPVLEMRTLLHLWSLQLTSFHTTKREDWGFVVSGTPKMMGDWIKENGRLTKARMSRSTRYRTALALALGVLIGVVGVLWGLPASREEDAADQLQA